jgi:shikimate dehydrogenase
MGASGSIGSRTTVVGVFGHPVAHSLSPHMHNDALRTQGIDMVYLAFDVLPESLSDAVMGLRALGFRGVNVTIPHKESILSLLDDVDTAAARIGSVNTVVNDNGRLIGYNTDKSGFAAALRGLRPEGARGLSCFVAGAGGAARAVVAALMDDGAHEIQIYNRTPERAISLCSEAASWGGTRCLAVPEDEVFHAAGEAHIIVNATSVGLMPSVKESPVPVDILHSRHIVMDLVYGPGPTALVREAKARGATAIDGKEMLVMQAAGSYELWTGRQAPVNVMRQSIDGER